MLGDTGVCSCTGLPVRQQGMIVRPTDEQCLPGPEIEHENGAGSSEIQRRLSGKPARPGRVPSRANDSGCNLRQPSLSGRRHNGGGRAGGPGGRRRGTLRRSAYITSTVLN
jgi:hypothetical protein